MSRTKNIIEMINILQDRNGERVKIGELTRALNVDEKTIRKYRDAILSELHIHIDSKTGVNGGYKLDKRVINFGRSLSEEEFSALIMGQEYLKNEEGFIYIDEFDSAVEKIQSSIKLSDNNIYQDNSSIIYESKPNINKDIEKEKYKKINKCIIKRNKIKITYFSLDSGDMERIVHPYAVFMYKGFWYFTGYCELRKEIRSFKLSRINKYEIIEEEFEIIKDFNLKESIDNGIGFYSEKQCKLKLKVKHPMSAIIRERIWSNDQKITLNDEDKSILLEATMAQSPETIGWILSMGKNVVVLEPENIKEAVKDEIKKMKNLY